MKKKFLLLLAATGLICSVFTLCVSADFARSKSYTDGMFSDVPSSEWYASWVKDAYEFGLMQGNSASTFNPKGTLTVAEGITIACRIHQTLNNTVIPQASGEWYQAYVNYAIANGFMTDGQFDSYTANIKRFEIAQLLAEVCGELNSVNTLSTLPDVPSGAEYADAVIMLYNKGILAGNDDYGTFAPYSYLQRNEISAMAVRIADSTKRVKKLIKGVPARAFTDSYYIIENVWGATNGWTYDNRFDLFNTTGAASATLRDTNDEQFYALNRDFKPESEGILRLELTGAFSSVGDKGVYIALQNAEGERIVELTPVGTAWTLNGTDTAYSTVRITEEEVYYAFVIEVDLDNNTATAIINNSKCGVVNIKPDAVLERLVLGTNKVGKGMVRKDHVRMSKNYPLDENFLITDKQTGEKPSGWEVTGNFKLDRIDSVLGQDVFSLKAESKAGSASTAKKAFTSITGKVVLEGYMLLPEKTDGASVAFTSNGKEIFKFETKDGKIVMGDKVLHDYTPNVWQWLYVEANTGTATADIKINGKKKATVKFDAQVLNGVTASFAPQTDATVWFDDFEAYTLIDHADYPSYPQVAESKDYNVGLNVCYLWRDLQSGEGWDAASPFPEFDTYLGFYDDGLRETADWELKWMAEHGIDFMHVCWYCPNGDQKAPIKKMRVSHSALNDGYMNAKYSDLVDFCIMWENNGQDVTSFEQFKEFIWPYWKEYYFADERYARLDNKAVLTVWNKDKMKTAFGGTNQGVKQAFDFMEAELIEMGYDGLLVLYQTQGANTEAQYKDLEEMGFDSTYGYHWGRLGYDMQHQIDCSDANAEASRNYAHHIPTVSVGFNDVGRNNSRDPIITKEDHLKVCEHLKDILSTYNTGTWKDNTVFVSTWNEYTEGTYVMPTASNGFDYLENVRKVFTDDTSDHSALDVKPSETQVNRVERMYPPNHSPIRWHQFEKPDNSADVSDAAALSAVRTYDMAQGGAGFWENMFGMTEYKEENGVISGKSDSPDYAIRSSLGLFDSLEADKAPILHIRLKSSKQANIEVFFITSRDAKWDEKKMKSTAITKTGEFVDYYINMSSLETWKDSITSVRIDPMNAPGSFEIALIEFMNFKNADDNAPAVEVNGVKLEFVFDPIVLADGDYEVVGEARKGFYSLLRLYYEWDRFTDDGILTLKTYDEHTYVFKIGSDKVWVDGVERSLGYTMKLRDGMPVFHMKKLLDLIGYKYTVNNSTIEVQAATDEQYKLLKSRVENEWEFELKGVTEGFTPQHGSVDSTGDGTLSFTATGSDVAIIRSVNFPADKYTHITVGIEYTDALIGQTSQLFFTTASSTSFTADKCISFKADLADKKSGDTVELKFNLSDNSKFSGQITNIRIDPFNKKGDFKIDYVRCIYEDAGNEKAKLILNENLIWTFDNNGDNLGWTGQNSTITAAGGYLEGICTNADIAIIKDVEFDVADAQIVVAGVKYDPSYCNGTAELFFTTDLSTELSADKSVSSKYSVPAFTNPGDTVEIAFDLTKNSKFLSKIQKLRIDFHSGTFPFSVDYVKCYKIPDYVPAVVPQKVINQATLPTEVVISDPTKLPDGIKVSTSVSGGISVVPDPENADEKAFRVKCIMDGEQYTYLYVYMNFVAGKKYNVSYKIYPLKNRNGDDFSNTIIGGNFMYGIDGETIQNHTFDSGTDKSSGSGWVSVSETVDISPDYNPTTNDHFEIWGKFSGGAGVEYLVKDIRIELAE